MEIQTTKCKNTEDLCVFDSPHTDSFAVLNYSFAHPKAAYASIASAIFRRVRALCTEEVDRRAAQLEKGKTLRSTLVHSKDRLTLDRTRNCVWKIKCNDCTKVYIGQTVRELHTRIGEHKRSISKPPRDADEYQAIVKDSALAGHALDTGYRIDL
ncbi:hypothetical protein T265_00793 [Opisthorchis viverrini]|uniref:C2H2-type domain-containing protein n=1 Tax=Opisthorchis viverrini TaxID=6198 RepID=A0A075A1Q5_OPIVI|nr:hypothetical protein T265_00793 [Opisthorchis viverrini]KER33291.1 hypothetical protein T265_00793 [Opisthorchis viverrini]